MTLKVERVLLLSPLFAMATGKMKSQQARRVPVGAGWQSRQEVKAVEIQYQLRALSWALLDLSSLPVSRPTPLGQRSPSSLPGPEPWVRAGHRQSSMLGLCTAVVSLSKCHTKRSCFVLLRQAKPFAGVTQVPVSIFLICKRRKRQDHRVIRSVTGNSAQ